MLTYYSKIVDRYIPPKGEKLLRLGRRLGDDRRLMDDRRGYFDESYLLSKSDRRDPAKGRRELGERRKRWVRMSEWRSRHD